MSYSRWRDPRFWPLFKQQMLAEHPSVEAGAMDAAQQYNFVRYQDQGIGRYEPEQVYARGIADLTAIATLLPERGFLFGDVPSSVDASVYGFVANIVDFRIDTPLRSAAESHPNLVRHCKEICALVDAAGNAPGSRSTGSE